MNDRMVPLSFSQLMDWILTEKSVQGSVFGVSRPCCPQGVKGLALDGRLLEIPVGPAAGPHTQLAQNIAAAYYAGGRFFELKTVQTLDGEDLPVSKPCIYAPDEAYNVEWSTELRVSEAFREYVHAWYALKLMAKEFELGDPSGFQFNMSVGYDYDGIRSAKIDEFIEGLKDASGTEAWRECREYALKQLHRFKRVDAAYINRISPKICQSITLSTLHGCPPKEIERIAAYLIGEKGLNTYVKCNPTLLGYAFARGTLDRLGFDEVRFDDHHFLDDLQYVDAVPMFRRLLALAESKGLGFGLKLTNTLPVDITQQELPGKEMYMSGRALFPLTLALARRLTADFEGQLRISFCGGADALNAEKLFYAGIWPITMATNLLKPGGYQRLQQIAKRLSASPYPEFAGIDGEALELLERQVSDDPHYMKAIKPAPRWHSEEKVPLLDCFTAPCEGGCPIHQDIPAYVGLVGEGRFLEALQVITRRNPLPFMTGTLCGHRCREKCTRNFYEEPVRIREAKLLAATQAMEELLQNIEMQKPAESEGRVKAAVVGGGPAGLAAAYFLSRDGFDVTVFEKTHTLGGLVSQMIPDFRIMPEAVEQDVRLVRATGVRIELGKEIRSLEELESLGFKYCVLAVGAGVPGQLPLEKGSDLPVTVFLRHFKQDAKSLKLGKQVVVAGGGNTAMDAARAAKRVPGVERVTLVYRRTRRYMPAEEEELKMALADGVEFMELLTPVSLEDGILECCRMVLGEPDADGRRCPVMTQERVWIPADTLISAVGEKADAGFYRRMGLSLNEHGYPVAGPDGRTNLSHVYVVGDGSRGPASIVDAIADAAAAAGAIAATAREAAAEDSAEVRITAGLGEDLAHYHHPEDAIRGKKAILQVSGETAAESERCLECGTVCEHCAEVCPNRANVAILVPGRPMRQIIHVDRMCNSCGNCATFCPYDSAPYQEKMALYDTPEALAAGKNPGFCLLDRKSKRLAIRLDGQIIECSLEGADCPLPKEIAAFVEAVISGCGYLF
jgi:putative selenate reductase